ncbi:vascular cell adhesion protein 1 isoform X1 [Dendrobates tinctorius]|uniref:vascular cell adhesion protein 1 isoform X1 n=1 Tax=Dendrobates tinctorius TaxID=92724 RepID=UPI003CC9AD5B
MAKIRPVTLTSLMLCYQIIFMHTSALDITLFSPKTSIKAAIGEELHITCLASKCSNKDPGFTWSPVTDNYLGGNVVTVDQKSTLSMEVRAETDGTYRCTVSCDNAPAEKSFTIMVYSFPSDPVLHVSSLVVGQPSRITCVFPSVYPAEWLTAQILMNDIPVATYEPEENENEIQNISLTHDVLLAEEMDESTILCSARLEFPDSDAEPLQRHTTQKLHLMNPPVKPQIIVQPSTMVKAGEEIRLLCLSDSKSHVIQWVKQIGDVEYEMSADDQGSLILSNAERENSGVYICYAQNSVGKTSSQVEINVRGPPEDPMLSLMPRTTVSAGEAVTIECIARSDANVTLWKISEDGEMFFLDSAGKVVIDEADPIDAAVYKCTAENQYGVSEASESLTVEYPPRETILSSSPIDVKEGDMVVLTCISQGVPTPNISISKLLPTGESVLLSEDSVIALAKVTGGIYQCQATNRLGSEKHKLELNVRVPPKNTFLTITPSHTVRNGDSVHIRCVSEASPAPKLVLKMKTEQGMRELTSEHGLYRIPHAAGEHTGTFLCEASNIIGEQTAEAALTVQVAPQNTQISITPSSVVREGDNVHIRCTSEASPAPRLALKMKMEHDVVDLVTEDGEYIISSAEERHIGIYICESTNVIGSEIVEAVLNVQVPPKNTYITISPSEVVREGDIVQIWCSSEGSPDPKLVLKMKTEDELLSLESSDGFYNISHAEIVNAGTYICESTNVLGLEVALNTLIVQIPPRNTTVVVTPSQIITEGDTVTITCETHSIPSPTIILQKVCDQSNTVLQTQNGTFTLHNVTRNDTGTYKIKIFNSAGNETEVINIVVAERQQDPRFNPMSTIIFGSVAFVSVGVIGSIIYHLKKAKLQGSYSLVEALRSKV